MDDASDAGRGNLEGQLDMFSMAPPDVVEKPHFDYPNIPEFSPRQLLMLEKECSGMSFSGHLLDGYSKHITSLSVTNLSELQDAENSDKYPERCRITIAGMIIFPFIKAQTLASIMLFVLGVFAMVTGVIWTIAGDIGGKAFSSTVVGVFDWAVYMGAAFQAAMFGFVKDKFGWNSMFIIIGALYVILLVLTLIARKMKTRKI
jgi:MFS family permease